MNNASTNTPDAPPRNIAPLAAGFEASLAILALVLGWLLNVEPLATLHWDPAALGWGLLAALPLFLVLALMVRFPRGSIRELMQIVEELVLTMFHRATLFDLALVSLMAGIGEEFLFRGAIQAAFEKGTGAPLTALVGTGLLFGLIHSVTRTYAVLATIVGIYLGWLWMATGNLLAPVVTHAVYDFGALWYFRSATKKRTS